MNNLAFLQNIINANVPEAMRIDANESAILSRQLELVKSQLFNVQYAKTKARQFIPESPDKDAAATSIVYRAWDYAGRAKIVGDYSDDIPTVDGALTEFPSPIRTLAVGYRWSIFDVARAAKAGFQLSTMKAMAARDAIEREIDTIAALGDSAYGLPGFLTNASIPLVTPITGTWAGATSAQILADMHKLSNAVTTQTKEVIDADTLLLPTAAFQIVATKQLGTDNDATVLTTFLKQSPYVKNVDQWDKLNTAGVGAVQRAVAYKRDPSVLQLEIPVSLTELAPQVQNFVYKVPMYARVGGTVVHSPLGAAFMDGI